MGDNNYHPTINIKEPLDRTDKMRAMRTICEKEMLQQLDRMHEKDPCVRRDAIGVLTGVKDGAEYGTRLQPLMRRMRSGCLWHSWQVNILKKNRLICFSLLQDRNTRVACKAMEGLVRLKRGAAIEAYRKLRRKDNVIR